MLTRLSHWTIRCSNNDNSTVHLRSTCNHIFNIISMARAINMSVMTIL
ncbi:hypothetical protein BAZSYMB_GCONTIG00701_0 [Bathymodiolus azoricus thioautotrophic gill symbiont]|uniref:Uncharacterized protein n=1 Tax=Bathymodiolus azoricus thioautotrophic gill symbiont TaxID=235205 RepID=A0A1H6L4U4_9GAMM|nr:hypothetical protein BAZSYMB_GCONTIG00701_0 [Bathymodiolus azoricus thioautotrophic gill symbiont]